jgi:peptidylprolyl isomerase
MIKRLFNTRCPLVYLEISINGAIEGKLVFEMQIDVAPKTCENFVKICTGDSGVLTPKGKDLSYAGTRLHRIVPGFLCQGGDIMKQSGKGGWSIYGPTFDDENFILKHASPGLLSMANHGPNTNNSQFFITFSPCPSLDGKHTVFGKLLEGDKLLQKIQNQGTANGKPRTKVIIEKSGLFNYN